MRGATPGTWGTAAEVIVTTNRRFGAAIALLTAIAAAVGLLTGFLAATPAVGVAVVGIVIGTGVARGAFSANPEDSKRN